MSPSRFAERSGPLGVSPGRFAERSGPLGVSPSRFAERSLRHPGFAHSCILAFALRAALDCKAGSFGPGSPLAYVVKDGLSAAGAAVSGRGGGGAQLDGVQRDGSSGAGGTSAPPRPLRGPRTRPVPCSSSLRRPGWLRRREARRPVRRRSGGQRPGGGGVAQLDGVRKRDGSSGAGGTSAPPRPLRGPRTRPVPCSSLAKSGGSAGRRTLEEHKGLS